MKIEPRNFVRFSHNTEEVKYIIRKEKGLMNPTLQDIEKANEMRGKEIRKTPLVYSPIFSKLTESEIYFKSEFQQKTGSFKIRGAHHKIQTLTEKEKKKGVVAASAGNHAQGVAYAASAENIPCTIVMPKTASPAKVAATRGYGATVILEGTNYDESSAKAHQISKETGAVMIHAFNDPQVIAAQGVIGLEILEDMPDVEEIYVPIGGGGLAAGVLTAVKTNHPEIKVVGVQSSSFPAMKTSLEQKQLATDGGEKTIADGISVQTPGHNTFEIIKELIDDVVLVNDDEIIKTMFLLMERSKVVVEPAGAVCLAYLQSKKPSPGKKIAVVMGGGNVDMYLLGQIVDKGLVAMGRLLKIEIMLRDKPGALKEVVDEITEVNANIVEVIHDRISYSVDAGSVSVTLGLETEGKEHADKLIQHLKDKNIEFKLK